MVPGNVLEELVERLVSRAEVEAAYTESVARGEFSNSWVDEILDVTGVYFD